MTVPTVREYQPVAHEAIDRLKLPEVLAPDQKLTRIHNLLRQLAEAKLIANEGSRRWPVLGGIHQRKPNDGHGRAEVCGGKLLICKKIFN